jgi:hypothetical protein
MKILLIGHGRHGKDTAAEIMRDYHGWSFRSSSHWAAEHVIWPYLEQNVGWMTLTGRDWRWFYENRHEANKLGCGRKFWYDTLLAYNQEHGGAAIARGVLSEADIYVGMRSRYEFEAAMQEELFDLVIWVDRSEHLPPEGPSMELTENDAHITIGNNGSLRELWLEIDQMIQSNFYGHAA